MKKSKRETIADLREVTSYCNQLLEHHEFVDYSGAHNGLQVENDGKIKKIGAAVDSHLLVIEEAISLGVDLLVVHHGLFWSPITNLTGTNKKKLQSILDHNLAVYSSHLPLDAHPKIGNNALLAKSLGVKNTQSFYAYNGNDIGLKGTWSQSFEKLVEKVEKVLGKAPTVMPLGLANPKSVAVVTGGAGNDLVKIAQSGVDTLITGEGSQWTFGAAAELGLNVIYGGHYLTETFGVKALAEHLSKKYSLPWAFIDVPTGL